MKRTLSLALVLVMLCGLFLCTAEAAAVPKTPKLTSITNTVTGCRIGWNKVSCTSYTIYRKTAKTGWSAIGTAKANDVSFNDTTAVSGTTYTYTMRAVKGKVRSDFDKKGITLLCLAAPKLAAGNTTNGIAVNWGGVKGAKKYVLYRKTASASDWTRIAVLGASARSYTDTSVKNGATWSYAVRATNGSVKSSYYTNVACKFISAPVVSVKIGAYTPDNKSANTVSWNAVTGADSYIVYRRSTGTNWAVIASGVTGTSFVDTTANSGVISTYTVRAVSGTDRSGFYYAGASAWNQGSSALESSFNLYKAAVNAVQAGYAGYTMNNWLDNFKILVDGKDMTSIAKSALGKSEEGADTFKKGEPEAKELFPVCTLTDLSKLKSCVMTDKGSYYHVEIVTLGEENPTKDSFLNQITNGIMTADDLNHLFGDTGMEGMSVSNAAINYKSVTISADIAKDGCFKSLLLKSDATIAATLKMSGMSDQKINASFVSCTEYKAFNY